MPYNQLGRPLLVSTSAPSIAIRDLKDAKISIGNKLADHRSGDSRFMRGSVGQDDTKISLVTTDIAALGWVCGMEVTNLAVALKGPGAKTASTGAITDQTTAVGYTCTNARVTSPFKVSAKADGTPADIEVEFVPAVVDATDVDPVTGLDLSYSLPSPTQAKYYQLGKPQSLQFSADGKTVTLTTLGDTTFQFAPKLNMHYGNRRYPRVTVGTDETTLEFTTTDAAVLLLAQGVEATDITLEEAAISASSNADTSLNDQGNQAFKAEVSCMRVVDVVEIGANGESREPSEFKVKLQAAVAESGVGAGQDPTVAWTITGGA